jgi:hypothetical protein
MKILSAIILLLCLFESKPMVLFDFNLKSDLSNWYVVDDGVMGGLSAGNLSLDENGHAVYSGTVSLENYGGFSSIRYQFKRMDVGSFDKMVLRVKGDGKRYQFRVKSKRYERPSYIQYFTTNGDWQTIEISLADLYPTFRGCTLNMPNYPGEVMEEIAILVGNKKAESFRLVIDKIELQ